MKLLLLRGLLLCALLTPAIAQPAAPDRPPNIVFILVDDVDFNELGFYPEGRDKVWTPHLDGLLRDSMRFDNMRVVSPVCVPSRYAILTGRYPGRSLAFQEHASDQPISIENINQPRLGIAAPTIEPGETTLAHHLNARGYVTGLFGKYHNDRAAIDRPVHNRRATKALQRAPGAAQDPTVLAEVRRYYDEVSARIARDTGFDEVGRIYYDNIEAMPIPEDLLLDNTPWITAGATDFITRHRDEPFFLFYASPLPHGQTVWENQTSPRPLAPKNQRELVERDPRATPAGWWEDPVAIQPDRADALRRAETHAPNHFANNAIMTWLDDSIGALLATLETHGLTENTIIVFLSDHQSAGKFSLYDAGARVPCAIRWPGHITPGSSSTSLLGSIDLAPTLLDLVDASPRPDRPLDGVSFAPVLADPSVEVRDELLLEIGYARALVTSEWKYIALRFPDNVTAPASDNAVTWVGNQRPARRQQEIDYPGYLDRDQLYDLRTDPTEQVNRFGQPDLTPTAEALAARLDDLLRTFPHPFPVR